MERTPPDHHRELIVHLRQLGLGPGAFLHQALPQRVDLPEHELVRRTEEHVLHHDARLIARGHSAQAVIQRPDALLSAAEQPHRHRIGLAQHLADDVDRPVECTGADLRRHIDDDAVLRRLGGSAEHGQLRAQIDPPALCGKIEQRRAGDAAARPQPAFAAHVRVGEIGVIDHQPGAPLLLLGQEMMNQRTGGQALADAAFVAIDDERLEHDGKPFSKDQKKTGQRPGGARRQSGNQALCSPMNLRRASGGPSRFLRRM